MRQYLHLLEKSIKEGKPKKDRTGVGTRSIFGHQMRVNLSEGFPIVTTKRIHFKSVVGELLWFLSGSTNARELRNKYGVTIWDEWAFPGNGSLGPVYGEQWRKWNGYHDQISEVIQGIQTDPDSRRHIVTAWNPDDLPLMALPPCHILFQFYVSEGKLSCQLYQRSADIFLGVPFNIASYSLLTHMIAQQCGLGVGEFIWTGGDCHLYENHIEQAKEQLLREPMALPTLEINAKASVFEYTPEDISLACYDHHPHIPAPVAV